MVPYKYCRKKFKNDLDMTKYLNDVGLDTESIIHISRTTNSDYPWTLIFACSTEDDAIRINDLQAEDTFWNKYFNPGSMTPSVRFLETAIPEARKPLNDLLHIRHV